MKKFLYIGLILLSFCFVPNVFALDDYYIYNEDVSSPDLIQTSMSSQNQTVRKVAKTLFTGNNSVRSVIEEKGAYFCLFFQNTSYENWGVCATEPFVFYNRYIYSEKPFYALRFNAGSSGTSVTSINYQGMAENQGGYFQWYVASSYLLGVSNFHYDLTVNNHTNPSTLQYISVFKKYNNFGGELSSFTYLNNSQRNKVSKFLLYNENPTNAVFGLNYNRGFMYYNNTVFNFDSEFTVRYGYPSSSTTSVPVIAQWNEELTFPYSDGTISLTRLYFEHNGVGSTNGSWTFYRDATDIDVTYIQDDNNNWTFTIDNEIVDFTPNIEPVIPGEEDEDGTSNEDINNSINDINNNIMDDTPPDTSGLSDTAGWLPPGPVDSILNLPLTFLQRLNNSVNGTCSSLNLPLPYVNQTMELPCLNTVYSRVSGLNIFMTFFSTVISSLMLYYYFKNLYEWVGKKVSLHNDESWGGI